MMLGDKTTSQNFDDHTLVIPSSDASGAAPPRKASIVVLAGWEIGREIELSGQEHVFGRSLMANTRIGSPSVSREHAKIVRVHEDGADRFILMDLNSSNGTRVNDESITSVQLQNGDKIQMGEVVFKFVTEDTTEGRFYQDIHRLIHYDQLTGLLKMDAFRRQLETEILKSRPEGRLTLAMTDLDGLKRVNDSYGHLAGRMVVREMGAMIRQTVREQDRAGLYGGDETIIFYPETGIEEARDIAERLRQTIQARVFEHQAHTFGVTISQGLAEWPRHGKTIEPLVAAADKALYTAKAEGRNCIRCAAD
jgi:diguanylate cyclase (GGDEF)-like protein